MLQALTTHFSWCDTTPRFLIFKNHSWQNATDKVSSYIYLMESARSWRLGLRLYEQSLRSGNKLWSTWLSFAKTLANKVSSRLATRSATAGHHYSREAKSNSTSYERFKSLFVEYCREAPPRRRGIQYLCDYHRLEDDLQRVFTHTMASKNFHRVQRLSTLHLLMTLDTCLVTDRRFLSINSSGIRKVHQRVAEPHVNFHERQEFTTVRYTVSFVRIWSSNTWRSVVRKNSLLQTVLRRTRERKLLRRFSASAADFIFSQMSLCES